MSDAIWEQEASKGGDPGEWELIPLGNYPANIVGLFDIGTQTEYSTEKKETYEVRQLILAIEFQKEDSKGKHFFMAKKFTWSMRDNSNWYKLVAALTGKKFQEGEKFDPRKLIGYPVMAMVTHTEGTTKKGKAATFANLETISQFPDGFPAPTKYRPPVIWSVSEGKGLPDVAWVPNIYGKSVTTLVESSKEYKQGRMPVNTAVAATTNQILDNPQTAATMAATDDIPF